MSVPNRSACIWQTSHHFTHRLGTVPRIQGVLGMWTTANLVVLTNKVNTGPVLPLRVRWPALTGHIWSHFSCMLGGYPLVVFVARGVSFFSRLDDGILGGARTYNRSKVRSIAKNDIIPCQQTGGTPLHPWKLTNFPLQFGDILTAMQSSNYHFSRYKVVFGGVKSMEYWPPFDHELQVKLSSFFLVAIWTR